MSDEELQAKLERYSTLTWIVGTECQREETRKLIEELIQLEKELLHELQHRAKEELLREPNDKI